MLPARLGKRNGRKRLCGFRVGGHYKCGDRPTSKRGLGRGGGDRSAARTPPRPNPRLEAGIGNRPPRVGGSGGVLAALRSPPPDPGPAAGSEAAATPSAALA